MSEALLSRNDSSLSITITEAAIALRDAALEVAALVGKVTNAEEQLSAVDAQKEIAKVLNLAESARKAAKEPVLEYGRRIDETVKKFILELKDEQIRLATLVGDFQTLEQARIREAQKAENNRLAVLERERAAEKAKAKTHADLDKIDAKFDNRAAIEAIPVIPERVQGQRVTEEWAIQVIDLWLLARAHPSCVKIEPRISEIKALLDAGIKVSGVKAEKQVKATVRVGKERAALTI